MARGKFLVLVVSVILMAVVAGGLFAQRGPGRGKGRGKGGPGFRGGRQDPTFVTDHEVFHFLLDHGDKIDRQVKNLQDGIETLTESKDPEIAGKIQEHVAAMYDRLEEKRPIHMRDPLFRALFSHADKIEMKMEYTDSGVRVTETSKDPYVAKLLHEHAKVVSLFIKNGRAEAHKNHTLPASGETTAASETEAAPLAAAACCQNGKACNGKQCCAAGSEQSKAAKPCCQAGQKKTTCCAKGASGPSTAVD